MLVAASVCLTSEPARVPVNSVAASSQVTYQVVHGFENPPRFPTALVRGSDGALYGATRGFGRSSEPPDGAATLFKVNEDGTGFRKLHDNSQFFGVSDIELVKGSGALLYGMTSLSIFQTYEDGSGFRTIHEFDTDTASPNRGTLIMGLDGALFGTTGETVFKIQQDGSGFQTLHVFDCLETGQRPNVLVQAPDGTLYGATLEGGTRFRGTLFKISTDGRGFQKLTDFDGLTAESPTSLIMGSDGALYGTSQFAGTSQQGTVFKVTLSGTAGGNRVSVTVVREFDEAEGSHPNGIIRDANGNFFGTGAGFVFKINADGSGFQAFHEFTGASDPEDLIIAPAGMLFGITVTGGTSADGSTGEGMVFGIRADGSGFRPVHVFDWGYGAFPDAALVEGSNGTLYGSTRATRSAEGDGTIFAINLDGSGLRKLHDFNYADGTKPRVSLVKGSDGALYGATTEGGSFWDIGTVFKIKEDGTEFRKLLDEGSSALITGSDGSLYGTTSFGSVSGFGTVFRIRTDGTSYQTLYAFDGVDGAWPIAGLVKGSDGALYGTTSGGGVSGAGTVFKINEDGSGFQKLHDFEYANGASPSALVRGPAGTLFGTTSIGGVSENGTVFRLNEDGTGFQKLHDFDGVNGTSPRGLVRGTDGTLYGTTSLGGVVGNDENVVTNPSAAQVTTLRKSRTDPACAPATVERVVIRAQEEGLIEFNDCLGEPVAYRGYVHLVINRVNNRNDPFEFQHFLQNSIMRFDGIGLASGARYDIRGLRNFQVQSENPDGLPTTVTWVLKTSIVRQSDGKVWSADTRIKIVFAGNGELRVDRLEIAINCRSEASSITQTGSTQRNRQTPTEQVMIQAVATSGGFGTIFKINEDGTGFQKLYDFDRVSGAFPSRLIQASDGAFYGTTESGGPGHGGVVFRFMPGH
jgi:uncharacterized repeat protein (TIGR03803 family)